MLVTRHDSTSKPTRDLLLDTAIARDSYLDIRYPLVARKHARWWHRRASNHGVQCGLRRETFSVSAAHKGGIVAGAREHTFSLARIRAEPQLAEARCMVVLVLVLVGREERRGGRRGGRTRGWGE
jgi:hypothetical protein